MTWTFGYHSRAAQTLALTPYTGARVTLLGPRRMKGPAGKKALALPMWEGSFQVALWRGWEYAKCETGNPQSRVGPGTSHMPTFYAGFQTCEKS